MKMQSYTVAEESLGNVIYSITSSMLVTINKVGEGIPHPSSQVHDQLSSLADVQKLWNDLCRQTDKVRHLVIKHHTVLGYDLPYESGQKSYWRYEKL